MDGELVFDGTAMDSQEQAMSWRVCSLLWFNQNGRLDKVVS
jgi:hypothetical protein